MSAHRKNSITDDVNLENLDRNKSIRKDSFQNENPNRSYDPMNKTVDYNEDGDNDLILSSNASNNIDSLYNHMDSFLNQTRNNFARFNDDVVVGDDDDDDFDDELINDDNEKDRNNANYRVNYFRDLDPSINSSLLSSVPSTSNLALEIQSIRTLFDKLNNRYKNVESVLQHLQHQFTESHQRNKESIKKLASLNDEIAKINLIESSFESNRS
ncbi:hypothetical protein SSS_09921 [Sarcoptes scabiei]|uniref:Uncharacterized protein n=1 Tax=Sarcoptes scabiei TaxID=52283 RepID=A0A834RHU0_SARSC|nr:hypothetical protein SSS_09921 [Sarcoptes scabiei]